MHRAASGGRECRRAFPTSCRTSKNTFVARGRIALSGGILRPLGTGRRLEIIGSFESARTLWGQTGGVKKAARPIVRRLRGVAISHLVTPIATKAAIARGTAGGRAEGR